MNASSLPVKIAMLVVLCGALLLPVASIMGLIDERADLQKEHLISFYQFMTTLGIASEAIALV